MNRISNGLRRNLLATELRRLRTEAGLIGPKVAKELGWSPAKLSRLESGGTKPAEIDVSSLLALYEVPEAEHSRYLELAHQATQPNWWDSFVKDLPASYVDYIAYEHEASAVINWEPSIIPGLLQTAAYVEACHRPGEDHFALPPSVVRARTRVRMKRQELLTAPDRPLELTAVIDEAILYRLVGGRKLMRDQLEHLLEMSQLPNVTIRVMELANPYPLMGTTSLSQFKFAPLERPAGFQQSEITYSETAIGGEFVFDEAETYQYGRMIDRITQAALDPDKSIEVIRAARNRLDE